MTVPRELVHSWHDCNDTIDIHHEAGGQGLSILHHHCDVLQLESPPLSHFTCEASFSHSKPVKVCYVLRTTEVVDISIPALFLRGPPQLI